ncbi:hypothetical protein AWN76_004790 [Rhodothermaceae bacterium RA]|nr:hypothetical protein AWN76_004790 [Rhodothermaceae bacterium RA]
MLQIKKILFPTDLSECAEDAFSQAAFLADRFEAELHVLHVVVPHASPLHRLVEDDAPDEAQADAQFEWAVELDAERQQPERVPLIHRQVEHGSASAAIMAYAEDEDIDLIVMGTHGRSGVRRLVLGSVAEAVVREAPCPVLTVHPGDRQGGAATVRRILVPVDFSENATQAIRYARELARLYDARLDLLHAYEEIAIPDVYGVGPVMLPAQTISERVAEALEKLRRETIGSDVPTETHVLIGHPALTILDFAERHGVDLIVIATHGWSGLKRLLLGSITEKVIRMAPCPVFTVRSFGKDLIVEEPAANASSPS